MIWNLEKYNFIHKKIDNRTKKAIKIQLLKKLEDVLLQEWGEYMEKKNYEELDITDLICKTDKAYIFQLRNGDILKIFHSFILELYKQSNLKLEEKIISAKPIKTVPEIIVPNMAIYSNDEFVGYALK